MPKVSIHLHHIKTLKIKIIQIFLLMRILKGHQDIKTKEHIITMETIISIYQALSTINNPHILIAAQMIIANTEHINRINTQIIIIIQTSD